MNFLKISSNFHNDNYIYKKKHCTSLKSSNDSLYLKVRKYLFSYRVRISVYVEIKLITEEFHVVRRAKVCNS